MGVMVPTHGGYQQLCNNRLYSNKEFLVDVFHNGSLLSACGSSSHIFHPTNGYCCHCVVHGISLLVDLQVYYVTIQCALCFGWLCGSLLVIIMY